MPEKITILERLAVIETCLANYKEAQGSQTDLLRKMDERLANLQTNQGIHGAVIAAVQADVTENRAKASVLPNLILATVVTVAVTLMVNSVIAKSHAETRPKPTPPEAPLVKEKKASTMLNQKNKEGLYGRNHTTLGCTATGSCDIAAGQRIRATLLCSYCGNWYGVCIS